MREKIAAGRYRLIRLLGEGAFSRVYLAQDDRGERYACKIGKDPEMLRREAGYQKSIRHPLFPRYVEAGEEDGQGWLLMEYVRGETLESVLKRTGHLKARRAARIGMALARGLRYLHERPRPLVYRDLKPANILLGEHDEVRLLDLGCVCPAGEPQSMAGTPGFGAPEQFLAGSRQETAADIYGLGKILAAAAGKSSRGQLGEVIRACVKERPEERLSDMRILEELLAVCAGEGGRRRFDGLQKAYLKGEIRIRKNILEYDSERA